MNVCPLVLMRRLLAVLCAPALLACGAAGAAGDPARGAAAFRACIACHSLEPGVHRTGPSLSGVWGRKAGALPDFLRYSKALQGSDLVWNEQTLDRWLHDPQATVPGNYMIFRGIGAEGARADLIAFLRTAATQGKPGATPRRGSPDLKQAPETSRIAAIRRCGDTYFVTNAKGETVPYWEFNLRFKTDSSPDGPAPGKPVMVGAGMQGDRAQIVFADFREISSLIVEGCSP
jgi:cytochrome c